MAKITSVRHRPGGEFLDVDAAPTAELERGREALLIWSTPEPAEDIASSEETSSPDDGSAEENDDAEADRP